MTYMTNIARSEGDPEVLETGHSSLGASDRLARGLGWFSIALGVAELVAPHRLADMLGMQGKESLIRAYGVREIGAGILTLSVDKQLGLWSRVAGDGLDAATLIAAAGEDNPKRDNVGLALAVVLGIGLLDLICAQAVTSQHSRSYQPRIARVEGRRRRGHGEVRNYGDRSGFPGGIDAARGRAKDLQTPRDMRAGFPDVGREAQA
ncbi:hypothetical protein GCM10007276_31780 [Agaricicola taiwanensis]|uniref:Cyclase dehydrase n=1 Tax=Agaricicola taiwanensis TaxID=591372 RepID=A0A8J2YM62_9RHOB|nr:hypothetical protein [Agaricicola taiwanensis]GGE52420.1 hypothetical protein GCM10007276_31780 [Agaricicola taiwanensis]